MTAVICSAGDETMFPVGLNRRRISCALKLLCLVSLIISTIIILLQQNQQYASGSSAAVDEGRVSAAAAAAGSAHESRGRISLSSSSWTRENRENPSRASSSAVLPLHNNKEKTSHPEPDQESIGSRQQGREAGRRGGGEGEDGQAAEADDAAATAASLHNHGTQPILLPLCPLSFADATATPGPSSFPALFHDYAFAAFF